MVKYILKNFSPGPLDRYRKHSSFDWKDMKIFIEGEEIIIYIVCVYTHIFYNMILCINQIFIILGKSSKQTEKTPNILRSYININSER